MKKNNYLNQTLVALTFAITTVISSSGFAAEEKGTVQYLPLELYCDVHSTGRALDCFYMDGITKKPLNDQDLITFINRAGKGAYLTVKSKKGFERTYFLDPNGAEFKKFFEIQKSPNVSMRELGQAKYEVFAAIEAKAIKTSDSLDATAPTVDLVRSDPSIANQKFKAQLNSLEMEKEQLEKSCQKYRDADTEKHLEATLQEKRYYTHYLSLLLKTMREPGSCTEAFELKPNKDGSINLAQLNDLSKLFQSKCRRDKTAQAPACIASASSEPSSKDLIQPGTKLLHDKYGKEKLAENAGLTCAKTYEQGPFVISGGRDTDRPVCYGLTQCGKSGAAKAKTRVSCAANITNGRYVCPNPEKCVQNKDVLLFSDGVSVE